MKKPQAGTFTAGGLQTASVTIDANPAYMVTRNIHSVDSIYDVPDASGVQEWQGALQVTDQGNNPNAPITDGTRTSVVVTACTAKRVLASLLLPSAVLCLIATFVLVFWDIDKVTEIKMSVITVLIIAAVANIILVAVVAIAWKNWERKEAQLKSMQVGRQATSIAMDTNPAYMTPSGEACSDTDYDYPCAPDAQHQEGAIQMAENPAYIAITDY